VKAKDLKDAVVFDFETAPIKRRPHYPPPAVGVALRIDGKYSYLPWGHPSGNEIDAWQTARRILGEAADAGRPFLAHNAKFDCAVLASEFSITLPWDQIHDTLPALFLHDPRADGFGLKLAAEKLLGEAPEERDELIDWLVARQPIRDIKLTDKKSSKGRNRYAGAYVAYAPTPMAAEYAIGDVRRTFRLARVLFKDLRARRMLEPYQREMALMPHIMAMEAAGVRVNIDALARDVAKYTTALERVHRWIAKRLGASLDINLESGPQLAKAIVAAGLATPDAFGYTAKSTPDKPRMRTSRDALEGAVHDPELMAMLAYYKRLSTSLKNFMRPWLATAEDSGGKIYTEWNSTRVDRGDGVVGARTGRFSTTPNFQNASNQLIELFKSRSHPKLPPAPIRLPQLPVVRTYIIPNEDGHVFIGRDHSQQELRILAHFAEGDLVDAYTKDPWMDLHQYATDRVNQMQGSDYTRKAMKSVVFGLIYGMGVGKLAKSIGVTTDEARGIKSALLKVFPGIKAIYDETKARAAADLPIRTWGGREYYCEEPKMIEGRIRVFDYKLPNVLIQGSGADITKTAMLAYCNSKPAHHLLQLSIHDELAVSVPRDEVDSAMAVLKAAMELPKLDVPLLSEGYVCYENWSKKTGYDKKGKRV
jgi:DNA polymerase I-like protein with 3'-5' exonuclease and polymerase domains